MTSLTLKQKYLKALNEQKIQNYLVEYSKLPETIDKDFKIIKDNDNFIFDNEMYQCQTDDEKISLEACLYSINMRYENIDNGFKKKLDLNIKAYTYNIIPNFKFWYPLEKYINKVNEYCDINKVIIINKYVDNNGGLFSDRPELQKLLSIIKKHEYIICSTLTQLSWDLGQLLAIIRHIKTVGAHLMILDLNTDIYRNEIELLLTISMSYQSFKLYKLTGVRYDYPINILPDKFGYTAIDNIYVYQNRQFYIQKSIKL